MKTLAAPLLAHYQEPLTTLATCWKCTLQSGLVYGFTNAAKDLTIDGLVYSASSGHTPSTIQTSSDYSVDNLEIQGVLDNAVIREADLLAGLWDYASIQVFEINYNDLAGGKNILRTGTLGEVGTKRHTFFAELRGLLQVFQQPIGRVFGYYCDANFCDARCKLNALTWTSTGSITTLTNSRTFLCALAQPTWKYTGGLLTMTSGPASGFSMEVRSYPVSGTIILQEAFPYLPETGDTFNILAGCEKTATMCADIYANIVNHRGFPDLPGQDRLISGT